MYSVPADGLDGWGDDQSKKWALGLGKDENLLGFMADLYKLWDGMFDLGS